jgi:hypothetical protein
MVMVCIHVSKYPDGNETKFSLVEWEYCMVE